MPATMGKSVKDTGNPLQPGRLLRRLHADVPLRPVPDDPPRPEVDSLPGFRLLYRLPGGHPPFPWSTPSPGGIPLPQLLLLLPVLCRHGSGVRL